MTLVPLNQSKFPLKIIEDLGNEFPKPTSKQRIRFALFECPICNNAYKARTGDVKSGKSTKCKSCSTTLRNLVNNPSKPYSTKEFIDKAIKVHGSRYDYSNTVYTGNMDHISIICKEHGEFTQTPYTHLQGSGCKICGNNLRIAKQRLSTDEWIKQSSLAHHDYYDYSKSVFTSTKDKITITCPRHGDFDQIAGIHSRGSNCPRCAEYLYFDKPTLLYFIKVETEEHTGYKIGITTNSVKERYSHEKAAITPLAELWYLTGKDAYEREQQLIQKYADYKCTQQLLSSKGNSELFTTNILLLEGQLHDTNTRNAA